MVSVKSLIFGEGTTMRFGNSMMRPQRRIAATGLILLWGGVMLPLLFPGPWGRSGALMHGLSGFLVGLGIALSVGALVAWRSKCRENDGQAR